LRCLAPLAGMVVSAAVQLFGTTGLH